MMEEIMKKINGSLFHAYYYDQLTNIIRNQICKFTPSLAMKIQSKQYKIYNKQIINIKFPSPQNQSSYFQKLKSNQAGSYFNQEKTQNKQIEFFIETIPLQRRTQIPLPFEITPRQISQNTIVIEQFFPLNFNVDFSKEYIGQLDPLMKYLVNTYQVLDNCKSLSIIAKQLSLQGQQKRFPLFFQKKKSQFLIGYLRLFFPYLAGPNKNYKPCFQLYVTFSNFLNLNSTIKSYKQHNPSSQQYFQNYVSTLPIFYHKFLSHYLRNLNIVLLSEPNLFDNINNKPIGIINLRCFQQRLAQKKQLLALEKIFLEQHQRNQSECCSIYQSGSQFQKWQKFRSQIYNKSFQSSSVQSSNHNKVMALFYQNIQKILESRKQLGIFDYLNTQQVHSSSLKRQQQKYNIRRDDDEMDELVGDLLGNPFKKVNKKVKANDQAQSLWMEPQQILQMKQLLQKQKQVIKNMSSLLENSSQKQSLHGVELTSQGIFDQLAQIKQKIAQNVKKIQKMQQKQHNKIIPKQSHNLQGDQNSQPVVQEYSGRQIINEEFEKQIQKGVYQNKTQANLDQNQFKPCLSKQQNAGLIQQQKDLQQKLDDYKLKQDKQSLQIIKQQINKAKQLNIVAEYQFPSHLIYNDLYLKNKQVFMSIIKKNN